jgi:hypothetical protein
MHSLSNRVLRRSIWAIDGAKCLSSRRNSAPHLASARVEQRLGGGTKRRAAGHHVVYDEHRPALYIVRGANAECASHVPQPLPGIEFVLPSHPFTHSQDTQLDGLLPLTADGRGEGRGAPILGFPRKSWALRDAGYEIDGRVLCGVRSRARGKGPGLGETGGQYSIGIALEAQDEATPDALVTHQTDHTVERKIAPSQASPALVRRRGQDRRALIAGGILLASQQFRTGCTDCLPILGRGAPAKPTTRGREDLPCFSKQPKPT